MNSPQTESRLAINLAAWFLAVIGWAGVIVTTNVLIPTVGPRWLFFMVWFVALTGTAVPFANFLHRRFTRQTPSSSPSKSSSSCAPAVNGNPMTLRQLPSVEILLQATTNLIDEYGRPLVLDALRRQLDLARAKIKHGDAAPTSETLITDAHRDLLAKLTPTLRPVINATGVILHTNLGRSLLSQEAIHAMVNVSQHYSTLEYDLEKGERGSRATHAERLLTQLTSTESALVVNNAACALLLTLTALAKNKEVIVSRGQLIEIGGGFRVPDVMKQSGAKLVEVGTTNRTHVRDLKDAITDKTA
ncbi:MAG: L-seryl-tRNA(Sec) selenium transferase, partial [Chloroflexi bacterium]|nr:L-seryl-tRNA(Sec) selenium transferase [Chloroflexota bacterium]